MEPFYNKRRKTEQQDAANKLAYRKLLSPDTTKLQATKAKAYCLFKEEHAKTLTLAINNIKFEDWKEEFSEEDHNTSEEWHEEFRRNGGTIAFVKRCEPRASYQTRSFTSITCKTPDGFDWFGFWDAESDDYINEAIDDYRTLQRQIRCAILVAEDGCLPKTKNKSLASFDGKRKADSELDPEGGLENGEDTDEDLEEDEDSDDEAIESITLVRTKEGEKEKLKLGGEEWRKKKVTKPFLEMLQKMEEEEEDAPNSYGELN